MGKYRSTPFSRINWQEVEVRANGKRVVFNVDVAKQDFVGVLMIDRDPIQTIKWIHPQQTRALVEELVQRFGPGGLEVVMEPSGTYGDALRGLFTKAGIAVYRVSPKRVHDAAEVYDGVPSLHDPKAAYVIGRLHQEGVSQLWVEPCEQRRELKAKLSVLEMHQERLQRGLNRLEARLSRHWPELQQWLTLDSLTLLRLIATYGDAQSVANDAEQARELMRRTGRAGLKREKIEQVLASAQETVGLPCIEAERQALRALTQDIVQARAAVREVEKDLESHVSNDKVLQGMASVVGKKTSAILLCSQGRPQDYPDARSYQKSFGLNLKERSSGKHKGQLKITKRGPGVGRQYMYFASMRSIGIHGDPVIKQWYERKVARDGGRNKGKAIVAIMRKLVKALWYVAQGEQFDATLLFSIKESSKAA